MNDGGENFLEARELAKSFTGAGAEVSVFRGLSFSISAGEMVAIVGASGAGKSTLLQILGGLDQPSSGDVFLEGESIYGNKKGDLSEFRNRKVGFVFQFHHLLPEFSALENVIMPLMIGGGTWSDSSSRGSEILERVGLGRRLSHRPGELSGGERQRVAIARALVTSPKILLADEPTGNLDHETGTGIFELIRELHRSEGLTSLIVTHNKELAGMCDRQLTLAGGTIS